MTTEAVIWTKGRADGGRTEVVHVGTWCGRPLLSVRRDGREVASGDLRPIDRGSPAHAKAPAGVSHLIGSYCFNPADAAAVVEAVAPLERAEAEALDRRVGGRIEERWARLEAAGVTRAEAEAVLDRWGRDGLAIVRAHAAEATADHAILLKMELASI